MNFNSWLDKYRIAIGIILLVVIGIGIIFLFWGDKILAPKSVSKDNTALLETKISELENKVNSLEQNNTTPSIQNTDISEMPKADNQTEKININTATVSELDKLPGVGATRAQLIIDYRTSNGNFKTISEIQNIKGIGPATYEKMKDLIITE